MKTANNLQRVLRATLGSLLLMMLCSQSYAQYSITPSGESLPVGTVKTYTMTGSNIESVEWSTTSSGEILSVSEIHHQVTVRWKDPGTGNLGATVTDTGMTDHIVLGIVVTITTNGSLNPQIVYTDDTNIDFLGDKVSFTANDTYDTYSWRLNDTEVGTGSTFEATAAGEYRLFVTKLGFTSSASDAVNLTGIGANYADENYLATTALLVAETDEEEIRSMTSDERVVNIKYVDGLGRAKQAVSVEASPSKDHIVQAFEYDAFSRQVKSYLPYVATDNTVFYQPDPLGSTPANYTGSPQYNFYQTTADIAHDTQPYSEMLPESSPLNRALKQGAAGLAWDVNGAHAVSMDYESNTVADEVRFLQVIADRPYPRGDGYYQAGQLTKMETTDEDGNKVQRFTNTMGQVILKRVQATATTWADTYYVYDDFGNLRIVLPPEASKEFEANLIATIPAGFVLVTEDLVLTDANHIAGQSYMYAEGVAITLQNPLLLDALTDGAVSIESYRPELEVDQAFLDLWAFQYKYDGRNRMIAKKVPGSGWAYMAYDKLDRLVLIQDANQRGADQWTFTKYDVLSRPVLTGFYNSAADASQADVQVLIDGHATLFESVNSSTVGYTNSAFPVVASDNDYLTATYFDHYTNLPASFNSSYDFTAELGLVVGDKNNNVIGQAVGSLTKVLGTNSTFLKSVMYYDNRYRVIQTIGENHLGGTDRSTSSYDFAGRVLETLNTHSDGTTTTAINEDYTYDHGSRLMQVDHQVTHDGTAEPSIILLKNEYNEIGQLIDKKLHSTDVGSSFEQSVDHRYNIRGWLTGINDAALTDGEDDYFGMDLFYEDPFAELNGKQARYNGNISAARWSNAGSGNTLQSAYAFTYDKMNRLTGADYHEKDDIDPWADITQFGLSGLSYDLNGNIESLTRYHTNTGTAMDQLVYDYTDSGNQLKGVEDLGDDMEGFKDGNPGATDYTYDANGNMTADHNKDITAISYNHLNLPKVVTFTGNRSIIYAYDAAGIKLSKSVDDNSTVSTTDYVGGFIYEDNVLQQLAHAEGRLRRKSSGDMVYDYYLKDHLGNTRITFTTENEQVEYRATMETDVLGEMDYGAFEEDLFLNLPNTRDNSVTVANKTNILGLTNDESARLRGNDTDRQIGPGKLLEVMPGDVIDMETYYYYSSTGYTEDGAVVSGAFLSQLLTLMNGAAAVASESAAVDNAVTNNASSIFAGTTSGSTVPRAYLNYILFDREFNYIHADFVQVGAHGSAPQDIGMIKNIDEKGYIYVYVSNESNNAFDVYFDELKIIHQKGRILQEDHYYPFGMNINALSSSTPLTKPNNFLYNGKELDTDFDIAWYDYSARNYDPQLGRFNQIDPHAYNYDSWTPYNYVANNPILLIDPDGKDWVINRTENDDGVHYAITFTGAIRVSDGSFTPYDLERLRDEIIKQIKSSYTIDEGEGQTEDGEVLTSSIDVKLKILKGDQKAKDSDHVFDITGKDEFEPGEGERGSAKNGEKEIYLNKSFVFGIIQGDSKNPQDLRTAPHEAGHTAGLEHPNERRTWIGRTRHGDTRDQYLNPGDDDDNLMYQGSYFNETLKKEGVSKNNNGKGFKINGNQMRVLYRNRDGGK